MTALVPDLDASVLGVLLKTTKPLSGRQVARLANGPQRSTLRALERMVLHGVVKREDAGTSTMYELNREHIAFKPIAALLGYVSP